MENFELHLRTKLIFGKDEHTKIGEYIKPYAKKIMLHYGSDRIKKSGLFDEITKSLTENGIEFIELGGVQPNPRITLVREGIELARKEKVELILAVGGGSAIDSAKAIASGFAYDGDGWDLFVKDVTTPYILPVATILTIPAAGSEMSSNCVITNEDGALKLPFGASCLRPVLSVVNPEFFCTLPKEQLAYGIVDMMSHIFERYFTNTSHVDLTSALCEATLKTIMKNALILTEDKTNYDALAEIGFASSIAHNGLLGCGREEDWATHALEHEISAIYDIPHGLGLAILTPSWMRYVKDTNLDIFRSFAKNVMDEEDVDKAIDKLENFFQILGLKTKMHENGIDDSDIELMAKKVINNKSNKLGFFKRLDFDDAVAIYRDSL